MAATTQEQLAQIDKLLADATLSTDEKLKRLKELRTSTSSKAASPTAHVNGVSDLSPEQTIDLITSNLQETLDRDIVENVVLKERRPLKIYWGMSTQISLTGPP